jgi:DNA polymerase-3 subunit epsilon
MELNLQRPLIFFDIESTGLNIATDSIAELSFVMITPDGEQRIKTWRVCPWDYVGNCQRLVTPSAKAVNGLDDAQLAKEPKFYEIVDEVAEWLEDSDLSGFNSNKFDLPMLAEEFERVRKYKNKDLHVDLHDKKMIDVQNIYHTMEPRNLKAAYRFYCGGEDFPNAHTAEADTLATYEVLKGQLDKYQSTLKNDVSYLANFGGKQKVVDYAGRLVYDEHDEPVINFGKHKGKTARWVWEHEPSYFAWIADGEFTLDTKRQFALLKEKFEKERKAISHKPLNDNELADAKELLKKKFGQEKQGSLF